MTATTVMVGDQVQIEDAKGKPKLLRVIDLRPARDFGKRLRLDNGTTYVLPARGVLRAVTPTPQDAP